MKAIGRHPMVLGDDLILSIVRPTLEDRLGNAGLSPFSVLFGDEGNQGEISCWVGIARKKILTL